MEGKKYDFDNAFILPNKSNGHTAIAFLYCENSSFNWKKFKIKDLLKHEKEKFMMTNVNG